MIAYRIFGTLLVLFVLGSLVLAQMYFTCAGLVLGCAVLAIGDWFRYRRLNRLVKDLRSILQGEKKTQPREGVQT